jgi:hypothetical protein
LIATVLNPIRRAYWNAEMPESADAVHRDDFSGARA